MRVRAPNTGKKICLTKKIAVRAQRPCMRKIHMCWCGYKTAQTKSTNKKKKMNRNRTVIKAEEHYAQSV